MTGESAGGVRPARRAEGATMERDLMARLANWKGSPRRKPLILNGARQVGKTWLLREFGRTSFANVAYVSLDRDATARALFDPDFDTARIIGGLSLLLDVEIRPQETLVILDEIQTCPRAITALKYFCEDSPQYAVAAAGSLLDISANAGSDFPVGKVNMLDLHPLTLSEFLRATGSARYADAPAAGDLALLTPLAPQLEGMLKQYYFVGGMPEAVEVFARTGDLVAVREVQQEILAGYTRDFAKHIPPRLLTRTMLAWDSIPSHLSRENKKFVFGQVRKGARAADFEESLAWLEGAGLIRKVRRVNKPGIPLSAYTDGKAYKVFLVDVGLLGAMSGLDPRSVLEGNRIFAEFKGALTEQYVCQELVAGCGLEPYYWSAENSTGEVDFLVQREGRVYPVEVKAEENLRSKSLRAFCDRYQGMEARRFSLSGPRDQGWMRNVPLWAIGNARVWE